MDPKLFRPNVRLYGDVGVQMLAVALDQISSIPAEDPLVLELTTSGGDADIGRRIALEARLFADSGRSIFFLGKTAVMSAGITIMSAFPASARFVDRGCLLMIHERRVERQIHLSGALKTNIQSAREAIAQLEAGIAIQKVDFADLAQGSKISIEDIEAKVVETDWYLTAPEAVELGLVASLF